MLRVMDSDTQLLPDDFFALLKDKANYESEKVYDRLIKYLRHIERKEAGKGKDELMFLLQQGTIGLSVALKINSLLCDLDRPYSIKILH